MRNSSAGPIAVLAAMLAASPLAMAQAGAALNNTLYSQIEAKDPSSGGPAPKQDLSGVWTGPIGATAGPLPPLTPLGQKLMAANKPESKFGTAHSTDPLNTCDPLGMPRSLLFETRGISFAQMPGKIVILQQYQRVWRDVWMDGRELPKNIDQKGGTASRWYGYSVGHWDGDNTLVVDTIGMDPRTWVDRRGYPHSVDAHVIERYTRKDHNHLTMTETIDDPAYYTKPFVMATNDFKWAIPQDHPEAVAVPYTDEHVCVPSDALDYIKLMVDQADEDAATGNKKK